MTCWARDNSLGEGVGDQADEQSVNESGTYGFDLSHDTHV